MAEAESSPACLPKSCNKRFLEVAGENAFELDAEEECFFGVPK
jgi:hypothetical protein